MKSIAILLLSSLLMHAQTISLDKNLSTVTPNQQVKNQDVKFIFETALSTAQWEPGVSTINNSNQKLLDYDTEGLNLYSLKGKINIFDSDVLTIEKYGSFAGTTKQDQLIENFKKDTSENDAVEGLNISIKAFLLLKYFYLKDYKYLDALEYQYSTYKFYGQAVNSIDTIFWFGSTTDGVYKKDYFPLSKDTTIDFYTDFNEHKLYILELSDFIKFLPIDSIRVGIYNTNWLKPTFLGNIDSRSNNAIIHHAELTSTGATVDIMHKLFDTINIGAIINYGFDNYINYTTNSLEVDYFSYDIYVDYKHKIYSTKTYEIYTNIKAFMSKKDFSSGSQNLNSEDVKGILAGLSVVF